jgi:hypothetical protein
MAAAEQKREVVTSRAAFSGICCILHEMTFCVQHLEFIQGAKDYAFRRGH